ncbi:MAG TPA: ABC transporter permease [Gaiellales bacterium]|nr:ABC transporter permease [Gaiellales bacterium]
MDRPGAEQHGPAGADRRRVRPGAFDLLGIAAAGLGLAFLVIPLLAIFLRGDLAAGLRSDDTRQALLLSLQTSLVSLAAMIVLGTPVAHMLATRRFRGRSLVLTAFELPLVLPPAVAGIGLLMAFGRRGLLGEELSFLGLELPFTKVAVVMAMTFVASPLYVRQAVSAFEAVDGTLLDASRTLGAGAGRTFWRVALPLARGGLGAGAALGWARAVGEFGATIIFAGSLKGVTETAPIQIYAGLSENLDAGLATAAVLIVVSAGVLLAAKLIVSGRARRFTLL